MHTPDWCFVDDLEAGDRVHQYPGDGKVKVLGYELVRVPEGRCEWHVHTTGATIRYHTMERVPRVAA